MRGFSGASREDIKTAVPSAERDYAVKGPDRVIVNRIIHLTSLGI